MKNYFDEEKIIKLIKTYNETRNNSKIIKESFSDVDYTTIRKNLRELISKEIIKDFGYNSTNKYQRNKLLKLLNDDNETFYWIGFLLADGSFYKKVSLNLEIIDKYHLKNFINYLESEYPINITDRDINSYRKNNSSIKIRDVDNVPLILEKFDIKERKTYNPPNFTLYSKFNEEQIFSLICGFIDGDGSIRKVQKNSLQITLENHKSWECFHYFIEDFLFNYFLAKKRKNTYVRSNCRGYSLITFCQKPLIKDIYLKAVELDLPIMSRKWDIIKNSI